MKKFKLHIFKGGSWDYIAGYCRVTNRNSLDPDYGNYYHGFRLVKNKKEKNGKDETLHT